jgi:hypothetical protein
MWKAGYRCSMRPNLGRSPSARVEAELRQLPESVEPVFVIEESRRLK